MTGVPIGEMRVGRNFIRVGDVVHVKPSRPGKRDGFDGKVVSIRANDDGSIRWLDVSGPKGLRSVVPDQVQRRAQTKARECVR